MAVSGISGSSSGSSGTTNNVKSLSGSDFLNLMIQQLSQQDPMNPTDSNQLLNQMAQISTLQSNSDMQASLASLTLQQSIGAGGNLIGKRVDGLDVNGNEIHGIVQKVQVSGKQIYLGLDSGLNLPMANILTISPTSTSTGR